MTDIIRRNNVRVSGRGERPILFARGFVSSGVGEGSTFDPPAGGGRGPAYRLEISTYERDLDAAGRRVEREQRRGTRVSGAEPIR